jgi:hypothetical protein
MHRYVVIAAVGAAIVASSGAAQTATAMPVGINGDFGPATALPAGINGGSGPEAAPTRTVEVPVEATGFDWADAGLGVAGGLVAVGLAAGGLTVVRRRSATPALG